jgi:hypothetical protein
VITAEDDALKFYVDCELASKESSDRHLRRAYFGTTALRNKMPF